MYPGCIASAFHAIQYPPSPDACCELSPPDYSAVRLSESKGAINLQIQVNIWLLTLGRGLKVATYPCLYHS